MNSHVYIVKFKQNNKLSDRNSKKMQMIIYFNEMNVLKQFIQNPLSQPRLPNPVLPVPNSLKVKSPKQLISIS